MFHLRDLKSKFKFSVRQYNKIVAWLNNVAEGWGMKITRPDDPSSGSPVVFAVDFEKLTAVFRLKNEPITKPENPKELTSGYSVGAATEQKTDTFTASTAANAKGVKVHLLCRGSDATDGEHVVFAWRPFLITADGRVYSIGAEDTPRASVYTDQG